MKIMIIHHSGLMGGGTLSCFDIIKALKKENINLVLSLPPGDNAALCEAQGMNINILYEDIMPLIFSYYNGGPNIFKVFKNAIIRLKNINKWKKIFQTIDPNMVLLNSMVQWPMIPLLNSMHIKNICFVRETMRGKPNKLINSIIASNLEKATGVAFLSEFDKDLWGLSKRVNQSVIPDLVEVDDFTMNINKENAREELHLESDTFYILYLGGMSKLKGVKTLIYALNELKKKKIELLFLGNLGTDLMNSCGLKKIKSLANIQFIKKINKYIKDTGINNNIRFAGVQRNTNYWYAACDVVVFPAEEAHQARPIYEAGAFKKPIIISNFPNYKEYLKPGVSGLIFEPGNHKELALNIEKLYSDPFLCSKLGYNNYHLTRKYHDAKIVNQKIISFINSVNSS